MRLLEARAAFDTGDLDRTERILQDLELTDLRECETVLSDMWFSLHARRVALREGVPLNESLRERVRVEFPLPTHLDYRMG